MFNDNVLYVSLVASSKFIGAGLATIGVIGAGIGIGIIFSGFMLATARNPFHRNDYLRFAFLGFALSEAMGLLAVMIAFLILYG
jgi:F-type H+-transporting ATPase subunit c